MPATTSERIKNVDLAISYLRQAIEVLEASDNCPDENHAIAQLREVIGSPRTGEGLAGLSAILFGKGETS